jgi:hypothetical protein
LIKRKASTRPALAYDVHYAVGHPARTIAGLVPAATSGTRSIQEECALPACTSGLRLSAFLAPGGRRIRIGIRPEISMDTATSCGLLGRCPNALGTGHR